MAETKEPEAQTPPKASPWDHGKALGMISPGGRSTIFNGDNSPIRNAEFRAAETLHGWSAHQLHTADDLLLSREDFELAIHAAHDADELGNYEPYAPALAPHLAKGVV